MVRITRRRISRRTVLKASGGMAAIFATGRAPAYAQATTIHWLRWNDFVPASDELLRKETVPAVEKALGIKLTIETINGNDIQARTTAAIQSGTGPDVICGLNTSPRLYAESTADADGTAEQLAQTQAAVYPGARAGASYGTHC